MILESRFLFGGKSRVEVQVIIGGQYTLNYRTPAARRYVPGVHGPDAGAQATRSRRAVVEFRPCRLRGGGHAGDDRLLESGVEPLIPAVPMADRDRSLAGGRARAFDGANVQRIGDNGTSGTGDGARDQSFGIAGRIGAMATEVSIPAAVRVSTVCQRSSIGAQWGSKIRRTSSRSVVMEKLTRRVVRAARACRRSRSRMISGPRV